MIIIDIFGLVKLDRDQLKYIEFFAEQKSQDDFSEYFDNDTTWSEDVIGGNLTFKIHEDGLLYTHTVYDSKRELTIEELEELADYTQGQWSDGIGEGFEQEPLYYDEDTELYLSPWYYGQEVKWIQKEV
jgi:hypothetical protein